MRGGLEAGSSTLYQSKNLKVDAHVTVNGRYDIVAVCFQYLQPEPALDLPPFAQDFFREHKISSISINCATNEWFQYLDLPQALSIIRRFAAGWSRIVTYGSSMGGYAALRFASSIGADSSIAVAPQFSPRSAVIPKEHRYESYVLQTTFHYEDQPIAYAGIDHYVIFDPLLSIDRLHIMEYQRLARIIPIPIPCGGHTPTAMLAQNGMLSEFILNLVQGVYLPSRFRSAFRHARRRCPLYWKELADRLTEHGHLRKATAAEHMVPACREHAVTWTEMEERSPQSRTTQL
jgi:pimeloyl-ACP methyl ester carboxylesterase